MNLRILKILLISLIIIGTLIFLSAENFTGYSVLDKHTSALDKHTFTKAVCDEDNYCEDYEISCENGDVISMTPTGFSIQFSEDWKDTRSEEMIKKSCS